MGWHGRSKGMDGHLCVRGVHNLLLHAPLSFSEHSSRTEPTLAVEMIAIQETVRSSSRVNHVSNAGFSLRLRDEAAQDNADRLQGALVPPWTMQKLAASSRLLPVHDSVASALCSPPREDGTLEDSMDGICFDAPILVPPMWFRRTNYHLHRAPAWTVDGRGKRSCRPPPCRGAEWDFTMASRARLPTTLPA